MQEAVVGLLILIVLAILFITLARNRAERRADLIQPIKLPTPPQKSQQQPIPKNEPPDRLSLYSKLFEKTEIAVLCRTTIKDDESGIDCQALLSRTAVGDRFYFALDPEDETQIQIVLPKKQGLIGYLPPDKAAEVRSLLVAGGHAECMVCSITGKTNPDTPYSAKVLIGTISSSTVKSIEESAARGEKSKFAGGFWNTFVNRPALANREPSQDNLSAWMATWKKCLYSSIRGVSYRNDDGSSRQEILTRCIPGETLQLVRDPTNPYSKDHSAIRIVRDNGEMLGYVASEISQFLADQMDRGAVAVARITALTGGTPQKPTRGANIVIAYNYAPRRIRAKITGKDV